MLNAIKCREAGIYYYEGIKLQGNNKTKYEQMLLAFDKDRTGEDIIIFMRENRLEDVVESINILEPECMSLAMKDLYSSLDGLKIGIQNNSEEEIQKYYELYRRNYIKIRVEIDCVKHGF